MPDLLSYLATTEKETDENTVTDGDNTEPTNPGTGGDIEG